MEKLNEQELETVRLANGKFRVLSFDFNKEKSPPPEGDTVEDAIEKFNKWKQENYNEQ